MRKQFEDRVRLVIYMDQRDLNALTERAKLEGRVLVSWARDVLFRAISEVPPTVTPDKIKRRWKKAVEGIELDYNEARGVHTAKSNRLWCMCASCVEYRRAQGIPLGGLKKAKK